MKDTARLEDTSTLEGQDLPAGWTMTTVGDVGVVELGRQRSPENHAGPCMRPYLRAANVTWAGIDLSNVSEMNFNEADFTRFSLVPGDVLLNEGSGCAAEVGKPAIWRGEIVDCCFQNTLLRVRPEACTSEFLHRYFYYCATTRQFVPSTQGVNIYHIGKAGLSRFPIPLPPLAEQRRIVAKLDRLSARSRAARAHLNRVAKLADRATHLLDRLDERLLAKAFRGELVPQDPADEPAEAMLARIRAARSEAPRPRRGRPRAT